MIYYEVTAAESAILNDLKYTWIYIYIYEFIAYWILSVRVLKFSVKVHIYIFFVYYYFFTLEPYDLCWRSMEIFLEPLFNSAVVMQKQLQTLCKWIDWLCFNKTLLTQADSQSAGHCLPASALSIVNFNFLSCLNKDFNSKQSTFDSELPYK